MRNVVDGSSYSECVKNGGLVIRGFPNQGANFCKISSGRVFVGSDPGASVYYDPFVGLIGLIRSIDLSQLDNGGEVPMTIEVQEGVELKYMVGTGNNCDRSILPQLKTLQANVDTVIQMGAEPTLHKDSTGTSKVYHVCSEGSYLKLPNFDAVGY